ncbi:MAG TPA: CBS domain-containing protein, partial [Thermoanaerobaculia bacterium]|nr:CBS domain-containing protein [Thermoanaerobaculia bacterium]
MELIATHLGADFDALGAMLAARRLFPGAELFFPGSREESVRRMLAESRLVELEEVKQRQVDPAAIERVVLCDVRQRRRLGVLAEWLAERPEVPVFAYDHHPDSDDDLPLAGGRVDTTVGATATLMVEELDARRIQPTAAEATVLLLGLYEDTGSLAYGVTSPRDLRAAARLLELGGDLAAVRRWATFRLDPLHLDVLHRMVQGLEVVRLSGHRVGIVGLELGEYVDELAPLVSRAIELAGVPLLFALFGDGENVQVIARGEVEGVDLGEVLGELGGGGHRNAAAARVHGRTVLEVRERLLGRLAALLPPAARAADLGVRDFVVVPAGTSVARAKELLVERRVNAAPVAAPGEPAGRGAALAGAVTRQLLDAALQHGMDERPVERVMETDLEWVAPDAPAEEVGRRMLTRHPRFVLVGDAATRRASGLISRMQVLRHLHARLAAEEVSVERAEHLRIHRQSAARLIEGLPEPLARRVEVAARLAREHEVPVYLVGGLVRDLLLGRDNRDLDLVVEGDGPWFARLLAAELGGRVREHRAFLTAVVVDAEGFHVDVATARSEFYRQPAALPEVATSALRQDLYRRDFTINTLAIRLGPERRPELIDHFGGRRDLADGVLRVLHSLSFLDDPTRVLRAVRLEQRLGFAIAPETLHLVEVALEEGAFDRLSGSRLREELILLLDDPAVAPAGIDRLAELGLLAVLHPELRADDAMRRRLADALGAFHWFRLEGLAEPEVLLWRLLLVALTLDLAPARVERLAERLMLAGAHRAVVSGAAARLNAARAALERPEAAPHEVSAALADLPGEDLLLLLASGPEPVRERVRRDLTELRAFRLTVRGADLGAAGVPPGPAIGGALAATRAARLDGRIGEEEELGFALRAAREADEGAVAEATVGAGARA